ncbi:unnamed protein product [Adineta ricciae]|uniref:Metalloendopeptidase OMA1, mitochondrial n=1 Tax=Adineta ricciae TaxID=249248 RepID=A0A814EX38_ADIRI|nr:unnamed protein product [Adineta ricciae]
MLLTSIYARTITYQQFHTSARRNALPVLGIASKLILKGLAWLSGRSVRVWYRGLPKDKRIILKEHIIRNRLRYLGIIAGLSVGSAIHVYTHIESTPISGRRRYMVITKKQLDKIVNSAKTARDLAAYEFVLPETSEETKRVVKISERLLAANLDLPGIRSYNWSIKVVNKPYWNADVFPTGAIYITKRMIATENDDNKLACILGHEIAHVILGHTAESLSQMQVTDLLGVIAAFFIWSILPSDWSSFLAYYIYNKFVKYSIRLSHSRSTEEEADVVGLRIAAKACYDVRRAVFLWKERSTCKGERSDRTFSSTHPTNARRAQNLQKLMPLAVDLRMRCSCCKLDTLSNFQEDQLENNHVIVKKYKHIFDKRDLTAI